MSKRASSGFVADGLGRLLSSPDYRRKRAALKAHIRQKYAGELAAATGYWQRIAIEYKIRRELKQSEPSPYSLWSSI
jgi:hypothetical protein